MEAAAYLHVLCALVAAKWASDLGYNQFRQLVWGAFAFLLPPLALLILYVRCVNAKEAEARKAVTVGAV